MAYVLLYGIQTFHYDGSAFFIGPLFSGLIPKVY